MTSGLTMPKLYIIEDLSPNAFATGRNEKHAVVAVTTGLIKILNKSELEAVIAHELSHIGNKDMLIQTMVVVISGTIAILGDIMLRMGMFGGDKKESNHFTIIITVIAAILLPLAATIVQLAISRKRELLADSSAVLLTRYPEALANALKKISSSPVEMRHQNPAMNHIYFFDPVKGLNGESDQAESPS
ncbi:MAG: M48 family metalloprotease [Cyanobium sp. MAG06]|nr:M48 family metalloprotease [Cyanobium sp. MAG06]